ncbi:amidase family protein [Amycolatopsis keratiniphila]|uniref:amidase family protein n=1 Tax=Amycolatopsis keratiniphila TaxID=129921 RepID=UPI00087C0927|nr:amidase family protein [Amycolatopsis keratiniphila]OLZ48520.1 allophanate hydrolase [Amycolatopsis keratiniphila subsp. nogabecina]SDU37326.1 Asp-tRNAAsn/Glu-tRNAGln amidotransferase A subunit [Amycolatopsis keratiniphila]
MTTLPPEPEPTPVPPPSSYQRVIAAYDRISEVDRPDVWITLRPVEDALVDAKAVDERLRAGADLPLAGTLVAVADVIDVAGLPTAGEEVRATGATSVARLTAAGAVVLGKTNCDRFGSDLQHTSSPYGAVSAALNTARVSGSASSGAAVAVALGLVDLGVGTDTAGAGRVPASLNGIVGLKPTLGLVPKTGAAPCGGIALFARSLTLGQRALGLMTGPDGIDPLARDWPPDVRLSAGDRPRVAIPGSDTLTGLSLQSRSAFLGAVSALRASGALVETVEVSALLKVGELIHDDGFTADRHRVAEAGMLALRMLSEYDALVLPTVADHPDVAEALSDPDGVSKRLERFTAFVNLLDLAAVTVPASPSDLGPYGVSVVVRPFDDQVAIDLAAVLTDEQADFPYPAPGADLVVFGAHLRGQPLNGSLVRAGARFTGPVQTGEGYRMVLLPTDPPQPGVVPVSATGEHTMLSGERWRLSPAALGAFAATLPAPFVLGRIRLENGETPLAVLCDQAATATAPELTRYQCWRAYLRFVSTAGPRDLGRPA